MSMFLEVYLLVTITIYNDITLSSRSLESSAARMFIEQLDKAKHIENLSAPHHWPFVRVVHRWPMDLSYKASVLRKAFP